MEARFTRIIESLDKSRSILQASQLFRGYLSDAGADCFTYVNLSNSFDGLAYETTYPADWIEHYVHRRYHRIDPVILEGRRTLAPFTWGAERHGPLDSEQQKLFAEASDWGILCGVAIPLHGIGTDFAMLNIALPTDQMAPTQLHMFHLAALHFHIAIDRLGKPEAPTIKLTAREKEVLTWISIGKTCSEVSDILGIAERTAIYHLERCKVKLGASTRQYAVVKAVLLGLIRP